MKPGMMELVIVLVIVIVIFGPSQLPKLTKMIGKSVKNLRAGMSEDEDEEAPKAKKDKKKDEPWEE